MLHKHVDENGRVRVLRVLNADGTSHGGFINGLKPGDKIVCPDWQPTEECGNGLHGWPWGHGRCDKTSTGNKLWQVVLADPDTGIDLGGKAKWSEFEVLYTGEQAECMKLLLPGLQEFVIANSVSCGRTFTIASGYGLSVTTSGNYSSASASGSGSSATTSGYGSSAITSGHGSSASTSGRSSSVSTSGNGSSASASGNSSSASTSGINALASASSPFSSASASGHNASASTSGYGSSASTSGDYSSASTSGHKSFASASGHASLATCSGANSKARSGPFGCIALCWYNPTECRNEIVCGAVGDGHDNKLKPHVWYMVNEKGEIVPTEEI